MLTSASSPMQGHCLADREHRRADDEQPLAAEQVAQHAERQLQQCDRHQEGVGDPGELGGGGAEVLLEQALQHRGDGQRQLGHPDRQGGGEQRPACQLVPVLAAGGMHSGVPGRHAGLHRCLPAPWLASGRRVAPRTAPSSPFTIGET